MQLKIFGRKINFKDIKFVRRIFGAMLAVTAIVLILVFTVTPGSNAKQNYLNAGKYEKGIRIEGIDVGGMTYSEARKVLSEKIIEKITGVSVSICYGTDTWILTTSDFSFTTDLDNVLSDAMMYGRSGTAINNMKVKDDLRENGKDFTVSLIPNTTNLSAKIEEIANEINHDPIEPHMVPDITSSKPAFIYYEGENGKVMDNEDLINEITTKLNNGELNFTVHPELHDKSPALSVEDIKGTVVLRSSFTTDFGSSSTLRETKRVGNITKATGILNGAVVRPGEEFSFNDFIGPRTEAGGWLLAPGIVNGNTYEMQAGGGICQVSTTLYNALLCSGPEMKITVRKHHSWPSSYADKGLDATVSTDGPNLAFINNSEANIYIFAYADTSDYKMKVFIYGAPLPDGVTYKVFGKVDEILQPEEMKIVSEPTWPTGFERVKIKSREGCKATAYRQKYINGEKDGEPEKLYTDTYYAVAGEKHIGTGDASLPKPTLNW